MLGVAFALRGTLVDDRGLARAAAEELVAEVLAPGARECDSLSPAAVADEILAGGSSSASAVGARLADITGTSAKRGSARILSARYRQISAALVSAFLLPRDGAIDTIEEISRLAIPAAILTNASGGVTARAAATLGFAGRLLSAEDIAFEKPAAGAYAMLVNTLGLPAETIYYVSADPVDVAAAQACGLTTVFLDDARRGLPSGPDRPAYTIGTLPALLPVLAAPYTRGVLSLRYVFHSALAWRPGHFVPGAEYGRGPIEDDD